jgi:hypothetical protein
VTQEAWRDCSRRNTLTLDGNRPWWNHFSGEQDSVMENSRGYFKMVSFSLYHSQLGSFLACLFESLLGCLWINPKDFPPCNTSWATTVRSFCPRYWIHDSLTPGGISFLLHLKRKVAVERDLISRSGQIMKNNWDFFLCPFNCQWAIIYGRVLSQISRLAFPKVIQTLWEGGFEGKVFGVFCQYLGQKQGWGGL